MSTFYEALYADASNNKTVGFLEVTDGPLTPEQKADILAACEPMFDEWQFVPGQIGATHPATFTDWSLDADIDHSWCNLNLDEDEFAGWGCMQMWSGTALQLVAAFRLARYLGWKPAEHTPYDTEETAA